MLKLDASVRDYGTAMEEREEDSVDAKRIPSFLVACCFADNDLVDVSRIENSREREESRNSRTKSPMNLVARPLGS